MKIEDIIISKSFAETSPSKWKLAKCRTYYEANGEFDREIVLNTKKVLIDGYVAYLIAKEKGINRCLSPMRLEVSTRKRKDIHIWQT